MKQKSKQYNATHRYIQDCFLELLENQPYEEITVTSVAQYAGINRKTFYLHYTSLDALLEECALRCAQSAYRGINEAIIHGLEDGRIATRAFAAFEENHAFWYWLLTRPDNEEAPYRCQRLATQTVNDLQHADFPNLTFRENIPIIMIRSSLWLILRLWIVWDGCKMPMEELNAVMDQMLTHGVMPSLGEIFQNKEADGSCTVQEKKRGEV